MTTVGPYELGAPLARGGTSMVFRARGPDGQEVALKLFPYGPHQTAARERFQREVRLQRALAREGGFVPILDAGDSPLGCWLAMPLMAGSLRQRLEQGPLALEETLALGRGAAAALGRAHAHGIVHRDVKPDNLLQDREGRWLVADLGLAKHFLSDASGAAHSRELSRTGELRGTVGYMPPEQLEDAKSAGAPADVFALGAVLWECLAGRPAFTGVTPFELLARLSRTGVEPLGPLRPDLPAWLVAAVERALDADPARRHADGAALAAAREGPPPPSRPARLRLAALAVAAAALAVGLAARPPAPSPRTVAPVATRSPASQAVDWAGQAESAARALARGDPSPASALLLAAREVPDPPARAAEERLARAALAAGPAGAAWLEERLRDEPGLPPEPTLLPWLRERAAALAEPEPRLAALAHELALRIDLETPPPPGLENRLVTSGFEALFRDRRGEWLELALAGLRVGVDQPLFPQGSEGLKEILGLLEARLEARPRDWAAALHLAQGLLRQAPLLPREAERAAGLDRGLALTAAVLRAPDLSPPGRWFALETQGLLLLAHRRPAEGARALEQALLGWHPRPDELCLRLSSALSELDRHEEALARAEEALVRRERRLARAEEPGRPRGVPLAATDPSRDVEELRLEVRLAVLQQALRLGRIELAAGLADELRRAGGRGEAWAELTSLWPLLAGERTEEGLTRLRDLVRRTPPTQLEALRSWFKPLREALPPAVGREALLILRGPETR